MCNAETNKSYVICLLFLCVIYIVFRLRIYKKNRPFCDVVFMLLLTVAADIINGIIWSKPFMASAKLWCIYIIYNTFGSVLKKIKDTDKYRIFLLVKTELMSPKSNVMQALWVIIVIVSVIDVAEFYTANFELFDCKPVL